MTSADQLADRLHAAVGVRLSPEALQRARSVAELAAMLIAELPELPPPVPPRPHRPWMHGFMLIRNKLIEIDPAAPRIRPRDAISRLNRSQRQWLWQALRLNGTHEALRPLPNHARVVRRLSILMGLQPLIASAVVVLQWPWFGLCGVLPILVLMITAIFKLHDVRHHYDVTLRDELPAKVTTFRDLTCVVVLHRNMNPSPPPPPQMDTRDLARRLEVLEAVRLAVAQHLRLPPRSVTPRTLLR